MKVYYDEDIDPSKLKKKKIAIIGYGSQGHAHAQNLRESGVSVTVADIKDSPNWKKAKEAGFNVKSVSAAFQICGHSGYAGSGYLSAGDIP